ncbi:MAG: fluoride efflux transporter CrcB [Devosiaceae bacterium]|nr:fluoride efflux transporter CrcB [Devosiaceae bacterium MH13]
MAASVGVLVFLGGGAGAVARYALVRASETAFGSGFPYGVLVANIVGSLAMGLVVGWLAARGAGLGAFLDMEGHEAAKAALATGLLGGFTTFSAFSLDAVRLWQEGAVGAALLYVALSVGLAIAALLVGLMIARGVWA